MANKKPIYTKKDPIDHILARPDMYVGSKTFELQTEYLWINGSVTKKEIYVSPALTRTFIEILSNSIDNFERGIGTQDSKMTYIKVNLSATECEIINDGAVIPIEYNTDEKMYNHTLIFGHLLSGSNYDDSEQRYTSGRNGLGAKLTNVLSTSFTVEGVDPKTKEKFIQTWSNNMKNTTGPIITKTSRSTGYTSIKWKWDLDWFKIKDGLNSDILNFFGMFVLNAAMITGLNVQLNEEKLPNKANKFFELLGQSDVLKLENENSKVYITPSNEFECFSFVNGIKTKNGGKHVNAWVEAVCRPLIEKLKGSKKSETTLTLKDVKPFFKFLVITRISNPEFDGQEKNELKNPSVSATPITQLQIGKILKWHIGESLKNLMLAKEKKQVTKAIATINKHPSIDGYDKANNVGSVKSKECILIVCEGLSAKTFAVEGIACGLNGKKGRDWFGIYPLRGKLLNTRNANPTSIKNNTVITNLMKIIGLDYGNPDKTDKLNYGKVCIITDADVDGIHIEGLILNFFHSLFPKLLKQNFVISMKTPILRLTRMKEISYLFDERTYASQPIDKQIKIKYFKGLGTTKAKDVKDIFGIKTLQFELDDDADKSFDIAFNKSESAERKKWLANYLPTNFGKRTLDDEKEKIIPFSITRHLNDELIKFFHDDCKRSIPNGIDGLKESQRKIVYAAKKRNLTTETKVAQFGAYVAENTNYHHGEDNLFKTIIKMAQTFPGTNNIPLLMDEGMFGTRLEGGDDAASPRYIFTKISSAFNKLFNPTDDCLLKQRQDDGDLVEPYYYVPTIPLLLINGCIGIGTGWMCNTPQFSPKDVIQACTMWMNLYDESDEEKKRVICKDLDTFIQNMKPWYRGFNGTIEKINNVDTKFITKGVYTQTKNKIKITELPIGLWNSKFQKMFEDDKEVRIVNRSTPTNVDYEMTVTENFNLTDFDKKMSTSLNLDNIVVFDKDEKIIKTTVRGIIDIWGNEKLRLNKLRKDTQLQEIEKSLKIAEYKILFIEAIRTKTIILTDEQNTIIQKIQNITHDEKIIKMLMDLPVRTLTEENSNELKSLKNKLLKQQSSLSKKTLKNIWIDDINQFKIIK